MNRFWLLPLLLPVLSAAQQTPPPEPAPAPPLPQGLVEVNGIAAKVNANVITVKDLQMSMADELRRLTTEFPRRGPEFLAEAKKLQDAVLQELIDRQLIMSEFEKMKVTRGADLPDSVVDRAIEREIETRFDGDARKFREQLDASMMGMATYRKLTKEKLIVQAMQAEKYKDAAPPLPNEVRDEYAAQKDSLRKKDEDVIDYRKIYLPRYDPSNPLATPETQLALAESLVEEIRQGADFAELARKHSQDAFAADGGLQTGVKRADLTYEFATILFDAKEGELIGPLETRDRAGNILGFTIARVEKMVKGPVPPMSGEIRELMEERVRARKNSERYRAWIEGLREKATIEIKIK